MDEDEEKLTPHQYRGKSINVERCVVLADEPEAHELFEQAKKRLLHVNDWDELVGAGATEFELINSDGMPHEGPVNKGDYFKIDIPGPGSSAGDGYDWVRVEEIDDNVTAHHEWITFRVRPASSPVNDGNGIAHFYAAPSSSTFIIRREHNEVHAAIYDRNIEANQDGRTVTERMRDKVVAEAGMSVLSKVEWSRLAEALLKQ